MRVLAPLLLAAVAFAACGRPFVPLDPPAIEVVSPDLHETQTASRVTLVLRVTSPQGVRDVTIDGQRTSQLPGDDLYSDTLDLAPGLNAFVVEARGTDGNDVRDTLFALRLSLQAAVVPGADLPAPVAMHAAAALTDGSVLILGGVGPAGAVTSATARLRETTPFVFDVASAGDLAVPRAGHSAHLLPDGRVLVLGGSARAEPAVGEDFIYAAEVVDPSSGASTLLPFRGDPLRRSGHVAFLLRASGRTYAYVVGGRGPVGQGVGTPSSVVILELRGPAGADTLVTLTPAGGAGILEPVTAPAGAFVAGAEPRGIVTGLYAPDALPVNSRLRFLPGTSIYPFQVLEEAIDQPEEPRDDAAMSAFDGLFLLLGGRTTAGSATARISVYAPDAGLWFSVLLERAGLRINRSSHTATSLPSGRIAVVGGFTQPATPTASAEIVFAD